MSSFNYKTAVDPNLDSAFDDVNPSESYLGPTIYTKKKTNPARRSFKKSIRTVEPSHISNSISQSIQYSPNPGHDMRNSFSHNLKAHLPSSCQTNTYNYKKHRKNRGQECCSLQNIIAFLSLFLTLSLIATILVGKFYFGLNFGSNNRKSSNLDLGTDLSPTLATLVTGSTTPNLAPADHLKFDPHARKTPDKPNYFLNLKNEINKNKQNLHALTENLKSINEKLETSHSDMQGLLGGKSFYFYVSGLSF